MPSNVIITFQTKAETTGVDQLSQSMEDFEKKMLAAANAANEVASSFSQIKNVVNQTQIKPDITGITKLGKELDDVRDKAKQTILSAAGVGASFNQLKSILTGAVFALPLTAFTLEAIKSEEITARFSLQLKSLGQSINDIDMESLTKKMHALGYTQTELASALNAGLVYFKNTEKELSFLDTALGISKVKGIDLATAIRQLGLVSEGYTRYARLLGVSMHTEITDPAKRAAAVLDDLRKKYEPLAKNTGTTAESFKILSASVRDTSESFASGLLLPLKSVADVLNKMPDWLKEITIGTGLLTTAFIGLGSALNAIKGSTLLTSMLGLTQTFQAFSNIKVAAQLAGIGAAATTATVELGLLAAAFAPILAGAVILGSVASLIQFFAKRAADAGKANAINAEESKKKQEDYLSKIEESDRALSVTTNTEEKLASLRQKSLQLASKYNQERVAGNTAGAEAAHREMAQIEVLIKNTKDFEEIKKTLGIKNEDDLDRKYKQTTLTKAGYELSLLNTSIEYYKRKGIAETEQGKKVIEILSKARKDALNQYVSESADANKEILGQIQDLATKTEAERNQSDQYRKAAKDIIQYASSLEQLKYKLQDASDAEKEVFKTPEGADELKKKIEELQKQAGEFAVRMDLIKDKYKDIEKTGVDSSQNINNATKVLNIEKQKSLDLTKAISEASKSNEEANSIERKIELLKKRATLDQQIEQSHKIGDAKNEARLKAESSANDKAILNLTKLNEQKKSKEAEVASKNPWAGQWTNVNQYDKQGSLKNENIGKSKQQVDLLTQQKNIEQQIAMAKEDVSDYDKEQAQFKADLMAREQEGLALAKQYASEKAKGNVEASKKIEEEMKLNVSGVDKMKSIVNEVEKSKELAKVQLQQLEAKKNQIVLSEQNVKAEQKIAEAGLKSAESQDISLNKKKEALELADKHVALEMLKKSAEEASHTEDSKKLQFYESMLNKAKEWLSLFDATAEAADVVTNAQNKSADAQDSILSKTQAQISLEEKKAELANQLKIAQSTAQQTIDKKIPEPKSPLQEKQVNTKIELRVEPVINIYPSIGELSKKAGKAVEDSVMGSQKQIEENAKKYAYQS